MTNRLKLISVAVPAYLLITGASLNSHETLDFKRSFEAHHAQTYVVTVGSPLGTITTQIWLPAAKTTAILG